MEMCSEEEKLDAIIQAYSGASADGGNSETEEIIERLIACIDTDEDGNLSRAELSKFMTEVLGESDGSEEMCQEMGDGEKVPADALRTLLRKVWAENPDKALEA